MAYLVEPSLRSGEPLPQSLDDGFSPPVMSNHSTPTHPVEPEPMSPAGDDATPNPTQLPVQPEFGPMLPPGEPDEPGVTHPHI